MRTLIVIVLAGLVTGCSVGIQPGKQYPTETFTVPVGYQEAYRRADAQPRQCLPQMTTTGDIFSDNKTGILRVTLTGYSGADLLRVSLRHISDDRTEVVVTASDDGVFDKGQAIAMRQSIESGSAVCRSPKFNKFE